MGYLVVFSKNIGQSADLGWVGRSIGIFNRVHQAWHFLIYGTATDIWRKKFRQVRYRIPSRPDFWYLISFRHFRIFWVLSLFSDLVKQIKSFVKTFSRLKSCKYWQIICKSRSPESLRHVRVIPNFSGYLLPDDFQNSIVSGQELNKYRLPVKHCTDIMNVKYLIFCRSLACGW